MISTVLMALSARELPSGPIDLSGGLDVSGKPFVIAPGKAKATVLLFISVDCPIANRYAPEIARINETYSARGVRFYRVYVAKPGKEISQHGREYHLTMSALLDPNKKLAKATGVKVTPEAAVFNPSGNLVYRGRIDDQNVEHGVIRRDYRRDLRIALDEFLAGKPVSFPETFAIGCYLPA